MRNSFLKVIPKVILKVMPVGLLLLAVPGYASVHPKTGTSKHHYHASMKHVSVSHRRSLHLSFHHESAAVEMPAERATQIQAALIKQGYLTGEPTGTWDAQTVAAMQKLQGDNGWQTRITPDSRALIKLGLGPNDAGPSASDSAATAGSGAGANTSLAQMQPQ